MNKNKIVYKPKSKIDRNTITIYSCGKFSSEKLILDKLEASILYI